MLRSQFGYDLPPGLIAQAPLAGRADSRLLELASGGGVRDRVFRDLPGLLRPGDLLVFNDTRVIPARLQGHKHSGGRVEVLVERVLDRHRFLAQARASKAPKPGNVLVLEGRLEVEVLARRGDLFELGLLHDGMDVMEALEGWGRVPLPPYIQRPAAADDRERYQTVYARRRGAVAAPTAGLHFDRPLLNRLVGDGVELAYLTLHVGAGTFQPVRSDALEEHRMHSEYRVLEPALVERVRAARHEGRRVIAVGTTVVRALESAAGEQGLQAVEGDTNIFIVPGYRFRVVDALITNFHLPESTLLMLVCAFGGYAPVMDAYRHAVLQGYRFFSYGDAMFLQHNPHADPP